MRECWYKRGWMKIYFKRILLGKLRLLDTDEPAAYISHFVIKEQFRNAGNGSHLLDATFEFVKIKGCSAISLHCAISNVAAIRFYKRHGFFVSATTTTASYSKETGLIEKHYLMTKRLS